MVPNKCCKEKDKFSYREGESKEGVEFNTDKLDYVSMIRHKMTNKNITVLEFNDKHFQNSVFT
jgi:hypothetical protein